MILDRIKEKLVPINKDIEEGISKVMLKDFQKYIEIMFTSIFASGPDELKFLGSEIASAKETYEKRTFMRTGRRKNVFDRNDPKVTPKKGFPIEDETFYLIKVHVSWNDEPHVIDVFLPYPDDDGLLYINGSVFSFSSVLSDKNISVDKGSIFCPIELREKLIFKKLTHNILKNGNLFTCTIAHENIYRGSKSKGDGASSVKQIIPYFLFAKYGMLGAFKRYLKTDIAVGMGDEINNHDYPRDIWDIYESTKNPPARGRRVGRYIGCDLKIAIKKNDVIGSKLFLLNQLVGGAFYYADRFPDMIETQYLDNVLTWRKIFSIFTKNNETTADVMLEQADRNIRSIDTYLDPITKNMFKDVELENFYDLLAHIAEIFVVKTRERPSITDYYDKRLVLHRHIADPLIKGVNNCVYAITRAKANKPGVSIPIQNIRRAITGNIYPTVLKGINNKNSCVNSFSTTSDNLLWALSTLVISQSDYNRPSGNNNKPNPLEDRSKMMSESMLEVLSPLGATKSEPSGTNRLNCFVTFKDNQFTIGQREEFKPLIDKLGSYIDHQ